jgi:glycerol-3-phosphate dehydrogenase
MAAAGQLTEGYPAIATAWRFAQERRVPSLPLLQAIYAIIWEGAEVLSTLGGLRLST